SADHSLFSKWTGNNIVFLLVYVEDIVVAGPNKELLHVTLESLKQCFELKVLGNLNYFLGLELAHSPLGIHLCQQKYTLQLLQDTGFLSAKPQSSRMEPNAKFNEVDGEALP
ncbi:hypothetical protein A2U01_0037653, partial [Trifolium medium]|nr:hypothetical protein [Trifolium medium]